MARTVGQETVSIRAGPVSDIDSTRATRDALGYVETKRAPGYPGRGRKDGRVGRSGDGLRGGSVGKLRASRVRILAAVEGVQVAV